MCGIDAADNYCIYYLIKIMITRVVMTMMVTIMTMMVMMMTVIH